MPRRIPRAPSQQLSIKRSFYQGNWQFSTAAVDGFWRYYQPSLSELNNVAELTTLFDEYQIRAIKVTFRPAYDSVAIDVNAAVNQAANYPQAQAHIVVDQTSTVAPGGVYGAATLNTFLEQGRVKSFNLNRPFSVYYKPKVLQFVAGGGNFSRATNAGWLRTSDTAIPHRGFHIMLQANNMVATNTLIRLDTFITFYLGLRFMK